MTEERAVLAGGWGVQDLNRRYDGVLSTRVGYTGGGVPNATYRNHGGHAEALEIIFDAARLSYRQLLEIFFQIHDASTRNRQGIREAQRIRDRRGERWISRSGKNHRFHGLLLPHRQVPQREGPLHCRTSTKAKAASDSARP
jgi:hypothetical protein